MGMTSLASQHLLQQRGGALDRLVDEHPALLGGPRRRLRIEIVLDGVGPDIAWKGVHGERRLELAGVPGVVPHVQNVVGELVRDQVPVAVEPQVDPRLVTLYQGPGVVAMRMDARRRIARVWACRGPM